MGRFNDTRFLPAEPEVLDEEAWAVPEWLSPDDCQDELGADWRWPSVHHDQDETQ